MEFSISSGGLETSDRKEDCVKKIRNEKDSDKPWVEKYRPYDLSEVCSQEETISILKQTIELDRVNLPHMLFYGPPGTGKTSTALAFCRELFGIDLVPSRVLELNASDERGIDVIRERVKGFAQLHIGNISEDGHRSIPPFKIIILDEADTLTSEAQGALRRIMEIYSRTTRFFIVCNYISRISAPLSSRCAKFRFKPLKNEHIESFIRNVDLNESLNCPDESIERIIELSGGDMRKAIMLLQSAYWMRTEKGISPEMVEELAGVVPSRYIDQLIEATEIQNVDLIQKRLKEVISMGYSGAQILFQMNTMIVYDVHLDMEKKLHLVEQFARCDRALTDGANEYLQMLSALVIH